MRGSGTYRPYLETVHRISADEALEKAHAMALSTRDLPIRSLVAVNVTALVEAYRRYHGVDRPVRCGRTAAGPH
ncbi:hypothetical protein GCM10022222_47860 [Amycolatopsis ultiminotia]|uniref:Uncharacterized protein n=1 Tax=Amycolatopsis ultiminotia TaxID=543629 RepID=A0ABP6X025_9PSEU